MDAEELAETKPDTLLTEAALSPAAAVGSPASDVDLAGQADTGRARRVRLDRERCRGCLLCLDICPNDLFVPDTQLNALGALPARMRYQEYCINCMRCVSICPDRAFETPEVPELNLPGYVFGLSLRWHRMVNPPDKAAGMNLSPDKTTGGRKP